MYMIEYFIFHFLFVFFKILGTIFVCISFLFVLFQCTYSQPIVPTKMNNYHGQHPSNSLWLRPIFDGDSDQWNSDESINSNEWPKYLLDNEEHAHDRASSSSLARRSNFWKRSNFWRKRANFWRRDTLA